MTITIFTRRVFHCMKNGEDLGFGERVSKEDWTSIALEDAYDTIARAYSCRVVLSARRVDEARRLWEYDVTDMDIDGGGAADHFKEAGFLSYWLRRRMALDTNVELADVPPSPYRDDFLRFGNEICAFLIGFYMCLPFETHRIPGVSRISQLRNFKLNPEYVRDVGLLLHHKNVSPHSIYLIYRSLFYPLAK